MGYTGGVCFVSEVVVVGVGSLLVVVLGILSFLLVICLLPPFPELNKRRLTYSGTLREFQRDSIVMPDDLEHVYADMRAWDRHLVSLGMLPIHTNHISKVGPIIKTTRIKDGDILGSYWDGEVLRTSPVPERVGATAERVSNEIQKAQTLQREMFSYESSGPFEDIEDLKRGEIIDDQGVRHLFF